MRVRQILTGLAGIPATLSLLAATSFQPAKALLVYNIEEIDGGFVIVSADGSLDLTNANFLGDDFCGGGPFGAIISSTATICTGQDDFVSTYEISGPSSFSGSVNASAGGNPSFSAITTAISGADGYFLISDDYVNNTQIWSGSSFVASLASLGFTTTGLLGTWELVDKNGAGTGEFIQVVVTPYTPVPGPLPLLGVGAAFGFSRRLRRRVSASQHTPHKS